MYNKMKDKNTALKDTFQLATSALFPHFKNMVQTMVDNSIQEAINVWKNDSKHKSLDEDGTAAVVGVLGSDDDSFFLSIADHDLSPQPTRRRQPRRRVNEESIPVEEVFTLPWENHVPVSTDTASAPSPPWDVPPPSKRRKNTSDTRTSWTVAPPEQNHHFWSSQTGNNGLCLVIETDKIVHVVEYNEEGQVYIAKDLTTNVHYQKHVSDFARTSFLDTKFKGKAMTVWYYGKDQCHSNDFLFVVNQNLAGEKNAQLSELIEMMDFPRIKEMLQNPVAINSSSTNRNTNNSNLTFGFTSQNFVENDDGFQVPDINKGTEDDFIASLFESGASVLRWDCLPAQFQYSPSEKRRVFLQRISGGAMHDGITLSMGMLNEHKDTHNPPPTDDDGTTAHVIGISTYVGGSRVNVGLFNKRCINSTIHRLEYYTDMCNKLVNFYRSLPRCRLTVETQVQEKFLCRDSMARILPYPSANTGLSQYFSIPCNVDPLSYHALFLDSFIWLKCKVDLSFPDMVGMVSCCFEQNPNTALFLSLAVAGVSSPPPPTTGYQSNYNKIPVIRFMMNSMKLQKEKYDALCKSLNEPLGIYRYSARNNHHQGMNVKVPDVATIQAASSNRCAVCLYAWSAYPTAPSLHKLHVVYQSILRLFRATKLNGAGDLVIRHEMALMSYLGLLPAWVRTYSPVDGRLQNQLKELIPGKQELWSTNRQRSTMDTIGRHMSIRKCGENWNCAKVENFLCKYIRSVGCKDKNSEKGGSWVDIHRRGQIVVKDRKDSPMTILSSTGETVTCPKGVIFDKWVFNGLVKTAPQIAEDLPPTLQSNTKMPEASDVRRLVDNGGLDVLIHQFEMNSNSISALSHNPFAAWRHFKNA